METTKADSVAEYKIAQSFIDSCASYYGNGFEDYLKQVKSLYPYLDLSKVIMDDPLPLTLVSDTIFEEIDDSIKSEEVLKDDSIVLAQLATDLPVTLMISSLVPHVEDPPA